MSSETVTRRYQGDVGRTRATERIERRFAVLPAEFTFTVDVEEHGAPGSGTPATRRLLDLLERAGARGTFFVLDEVLRQDAALVREIARRGHEVASHGQGHRHLAADGPAAFRIAILAARDRMADLLGAPPAGYRAPYFSLTPAAAWAPEILAEAGFAYSSSVLPAWNPLAGWPGAPRRPFLWPGGVLEVPVPVGRCGPLLLPFLGGMYLRWLPPWRLAQLAARWAAEEAGGALWSYCHPYDVEEEQRFVRRADAGAFGSLMLWLNRGTTLPRLEGLLQGRRSESFARRLPDLRNLAVLWGPTAAPQPAPAA